MRILRIRINRESKRELANPGLPGKWPVKQCVYICVCVCLTWFFGHCFLMCNAENLTYYVVDFSIISSEVDSLWCVCCIGCVVKFCVMRSKLFI